MSISIQFNNKTNYLLVKIIGKWTEQDIVPFIDDIKREADRQGVNTILLDLDDLSYPQTEMTRFYSGKKIANTFSHLYKIAGYSDSKKINKFGEIAAVNRGANFRMFDSESEAITWLLS
jgi:hypothetical protein